MRLLVAIPHYFRADNRGLHGSSGPDPRPRIEAMTACLSALQQLFAKDQCLINIEQRMAHAVNPAIVGQVDVVVLTRGTHHVLSDLPVPADFFERREGRVEAIFLGFECWDVLRERLGDYDYYAYMEDDLVLHDPLFFHKLAWFNRDFGDESLLQPNRYEVSRSSLIRKAYLDGDIRADLTAPFQALDEVPFLSHTLLNMPIAFQRPRNPHSGCYFLNASQMKAWSERADFLDRTPSFIGPLESAATLGIMRAFRVYKPSPVNAMFLEIQHHGIAFISQLHAPAGVTAHGVGSEGEPI